MMRRYNIGFKVQFLMAWNIWWPKLPKNASSDHPTVVWGPLASEPPWISTRVLYHL